MKRAPESCNQFYKRCILQNFVIVDILLCTSIYDYNIIRHRACADGVLNALLFLCNVVTLLLCHSYPPTSYTSLPSYLLRDLKSAAREWALPFPLTTRTPPNPFKWHSKRSSTLLIFQCILTSTFEGFCLPSLVHKSTQILQKSMPRDHLMLSSFFV